MDNISSWNLKALAGSLAFLLVALDGPAQPEPTGPGWFYTLINGSQLLDDCPVCDRLSIPQPMRGTFQFHLVQQGPLFSTYALDHISFVAGQPGSLTYKVTGQGTYHVGGEVAVQQDVFLTLSIDDGVTNQTCYFTNALPNVTRLWPMLQVSLTQTNGTAVRQYNLEIDAAPFRELWFSTVLDFQAGIWNAPTNALSNGDLLSSAGRVVKRNQELTARLGIPEPVPDLGLKDIAVLPGGEIVFSMNQSVLSETLGALNYDDLLSDQGRLVHSATRDLITAFVPEPPLPEYVGLAAVQVLNGGPIYFSVQSAFGSKTLGRALQPGDLLGDNGTLIKSGQQLLASFNPANPTTDYGLRTVYVWPTGEIWFSTRDGLYDSSSNYFSGGDLLSDQGYVVYRNADLTGAFQPAGGAGDVGLDALFVVTDLSQPGSATLLALPQLTNQPPASLLLQAPPSGHVFQLLKANDPSGPYYPASPITTDSVFLEVGALTNQAAAFYRLRQW